MAKALLSVVDLANQRNAERLFRTSEERAKHLSPEAVRFIATAEYVAGHLQADPQLEWSPAIIGLCTAIEAEIVSRILRPLSAKASGDDLAADKADKDIGRVAAFCSDATRKPPELGTFAHFLQTFIHSQHRRVASALFRSFTSLTADWIGSHWLWEPKGLHQALTTLTSEFRNRAAHIDELSKEDYAACRDLVIGLDGMLWKLVLATERHV